MARYVLAASSGAQLEEAIYENTQMLSQQRWGGLGVVLRRPIVPLIVFSKKNSCPAQTLASLLHSQA